MSRLELPDGIDVDDPRPIAAENPYTFFMPHPDEIAALKTGDAAKFIFREDQPPDECVVERMWTLIERVEDGWLYGTLNNEPYGMDRIKLGDRVVLPVSHAISTDFAKGHDRPNVPCQREYWDRCFVDACVLEGRCHADYLYREEPDMDQDGDKYPDSGWRIRGTDDAIAHDLERDEQPKYIALGKVLNADDRWLPLIDSSIGTAFQWDEESAHYVELD